MKRKKGWDKSRGFVVDQQDPSTFSRSFAPVPSQVLEELGTELKYHDSGRSALAISATAAASSMEADPTTADSLCTVIRGDLPTNRNGRKITLKSVTIKGIVHWQPFIEEAINASGSEVFLALILDTRTNGVQIVSEEVYDNFIGAAATAVAPLRNLLFGDRFRVLKQWHLSMPYQSGFQGLLETYNFSGNYMYFECFLKLDIPVHFIGTTGGIADILDNSLHILAKTNDNQSSPELSYNARVRFVDH